MSCITDFVSQIITTFKTGAATEHSYRSSFESLFKSLDNDVSALNEPKRVKCGAPDFIIQRGDLVVGHLEAKDLGVDIRNLKGYAKEQQKRYLDALPNLIYSNGLDWDFYRDGELIESVTIGTLSKGLTPDESKYSKLESLLADFIVQLPVSITRPEELAERMAGKAKLIKSVLYNALADDLGNDADTDLESQFATFQENLIHDITPEGFADIYAETICYGMFAARLHDDSLETFSRHEALDKLPKTNPFLKNLFSYVAGPGLDDRIAWIIDDLAEIFRATDVAAIMAGFGELTGREDPFLHFYETFLAAYNPAKRKSRGVWYTPEAVVNFIVRAVDEVLQTEFGLDDGLADISKVEIDWDTGQRKLTKQGKPTADGKNAIVRKEVHRVQVLDPATGTGTFLAEVIKQIAPKIKGVAPGMWSGYIERDLIPRIHGFEILMASYAMCHMKLDMVLTELGYKPTTNPPRQSVYLTNSLEEGDPPSYELPFARWLSNEVKLANTIKRDMPIMCVIGNPPYLGEGGVSEGWIGELMNDYKMEPGGKLKLQERQAKWLNDHYVKFIRMSSHLIEKNGEGVLGFITNHGYLDNPTFRGMRWHLLKTFDRIWVLDLHGSTKRNEVDPSTGKADKNVFDIQQGVAIIIAVKKKERANGLAEILRGDLWGEREGKYETLEKLGLSDGVFEVIDCTSPQYSFVRRSNESYRQYQAGFPIDEFMPVNSVGIVTARDKLTIDYHREYLWRRIKDFASLDNETARRKYGLGKDASHWKVRWAQNDVNANYGENLLTPIAYRPFDVRWTYYTGTNQGLMARPMSRVMRHMLKDNLGLAFTRRIEGARQFADVLVFNRAITHHSLSIKEVNIICPLYLYPRDEDLHATSPSVNFEPENYARLQKLGMHSKYGTPDELAIFDYIYGVLHCPEYRAIYSEFLKSDFPRIPWPVSSAEFWQVSFQGRALRKLHLMEPKAVGAAHYSFEGDGDNVVGAIGKDSYRDSKVWINETQYFADVPEVAWDFYIGGYQPGQKWLKDRKGCALTFDDVRHYQRIVKVLAETDRIMREIKVTLDTA